MAECLLSDARKNHPSVKAMWYLHKA